MRRKAFWSRMMLGAATCAVAATSLAAPAVAAPGDVTLMSRESGSGPAGDHGSVQPFATASGNDVAFLSAATNLGPQPTGTSVNQAWSRSLVEGANQLASRADGYFGDPADAAVSNVSVSDDGNMVAFETRATNLGPTTAGVDRVFVRDLAEGTLTLVAENAVRPSISGDGRWLAFMSHTNYDGASGVSAKVYVADLSATNSYDLVSVDGATTLVGDYPRLSADGRYVAFTQQNQVDVRDRTAQTTEVVSRATGAGGATENGAPVGAYPAISRDGRFVAWATSASNLVAADTNGKLDVYERDRQTNTTTLVSRADGAGGAIGDQNSQTVTLSDDGRLVGFLSRSTNFSSLDNNNGDNVYVRDVAANTLTWVHGTADETGPSAPQGAMQGVSLSGDGAAVFYDTNATILPAQEAVGGFADVFRRQLGAAPVVSVADAPAVAEGGPGDTAAAAFTVTLSAAATTTVAVPYATADGTADGNDYTSTAGTLTIAPGQTTATVDVPITGDGTPEADETFTLTLGTPSGATLGRATATATILNDDTAPPPPPGDQPKAQSEHTLIGQVFYRPSYAPGADPGGPMNLLTSPFARTRLRVHLLDAAGHLVRGADVTPPDPKRLDVSMLDFEIDGLPACRGCTVVLGENPGDPVADTVPVDFGGEPGQDVVQLEAGRTAAGGRVSGAIEAPVTMNPAGLVVRVVRPGGKTTILADSAGASLQCGRPTSAGAKGTGTARAVTCPAGMFFSYRLSGLPQDGSAATVQLLQKTARGDAVVVDTQDVVLDPGEHLVPQLEALDALPRSASGRVLYGKIATLAPYAPGAVTSGELMPDPKEKPEVALVRDGKAIKKATVTTSTGKPSKTGIAATPAGVTYSLDGLGACTSQCALELRVGKDTRSFPVAVPDRSPSVTRADLRYPATGTSEFLEGYVQTFARTGVRVTVADARTGKLLADSATVPDPTCHTGARCPPRAAVPVTGYAPFRLGGLPAERDVKVVLSVGGKAVDTKALTTERAGQVSNAGVLVAPLSAPHGRTVVGNVVSGRGSVPGGATPRVDPKAIKGVRLVDAAGKVLGQAPLISPRSAARTGAPAAQTASVTSYGYELTGLPAACADCEVELVESSGAVGDRVPVTVPDEQVSVTPAPDLRDGELTAGKWVTVAVNPTATVGVRDVRVTVTGPDGRVLADSAATKACPGSSGVCGGVSSGTLTYRLGGVPADTTNVLVTVSLRGRKVASSNVAFAPGAVESGVGLIVRVPSSGSGKA